MGSKWRKIKVAFGLSKSGSGPRNLVASNDDDERSLPPSERRSDAALLPPPGDWTSAQLTPSSNKLRLSKSLSRSSSKKTCSICLASMRPGDGQAIFTAECSHSFHFHCITSNVKHGNQICPVCRAKWKEIPAQRPSLVRARINPLELPQSNDLVNLMRQLPPRLNSSRNTPTLPQSPEPTVFNDDESLDHQTETTFLNADCDKQRKVIINTYTEIPAVPCSKAIDDFTVLLHVKAPSSNSWLSPSKNDSNLSNISQTPRASVDLVTVLDISGSMAGTKLALLKRAMGFVIQNLGPNDRLAVIAFSSTARRLFPLRRMSENGRQQALQAVNSLTASGGTNIAEGLRKGAKIMEDRKEKNPIASIILLSDGQDTYTVNNAGGTHGQPNYELLLPSSIRPGFDIPVHTFGFGADHDASSMHSISEISGGTFSFIETEGVMQDAFAQCIGGLLSVVVKDFQLRVESMGPGIRIGGLRSGSYPNQISSDQKMAFINVGDLYADEERDFLVSVNIPAETISDETKLTKLLMARCVYNDPFSKESVTLECEEVGIKRTEKGGQESLSIEVDRQKNRIRAAEAMAQARSAAENGDLGRAVSVLENCRKAVWDSVSAHDKLCASLDEELNEMQDRMASRRVYEASGRAYILSGLSSHSWQRATARGDSTSAYQTPSMTEMVSRSQASLLGSPSSTQRLLRPGWSLGSQPRPR